ncbi:MAG: hypothetical protein FJ100_11800 [Deltaproteobacteria bacterium]|nr:hypothetical protein [Deltaproteobacteria bacterium]
MSLAFTEILRGSYFLVDAPDVRRVCEVAIHVRISRSALRSAEFDAEMTGHASFDRLVGHAPIAGQAHVRFGRPRHVAYAFEFTADDGRVLQFSGAKHPSLMRPIYSATTLWGTLSHDNLPVAMVRLHFDLRRDLVAFLQSVAREQNP